ncbi:MAG: TetR/AcrR family transcriptional regulator [Actinomycetota bacterium]|nr:TetR/AcrR family transcriptional regulator [Actinomycetota bacterium]
MKSSARRTQAERRTQTRRALLDAAAKLFGQRGYHAVSLDEIAASAGYTRGALHYNFAGKHELLLDLLDERLAARGDALPDAGTTPDEIVGALPFDRDFSLLFLEFAAAAARDPDIGAALRHRLAEARRANVPTVARLLERAGVTDPPTEDLVVLIGAFVNGLSIEALAGENLNELDRRFSLLLKLLLAGLTEKIGD